MTRSFKAILFAATAMMALPATISAHAADVKPADVLATYQDVAAAAYADSVTSAKALKVAIDALIAKPNDETLAAARTAWIAASSP